MACRYATKGSSGFQSPERAVSSECSRTSSGHGDCLSNSARICLAYSFQGLNSRPNEWMIKTCLCSVACKPAEKKRHAQAQKVINHLRQQVSSRPIHPKSIPQSNIFERG